MYLQQFTVFMMNKVKFLKIPYFIYYFLFYDVLKIASMMYKKVALFKNTYPCIKVNLD